jgi:phosphoribosylamine--glycine ligase
MNVLVIGSGGREHAIAYALAKSEHVDKLFALPGNPGIAEIGKCIPGSVEDLEGILKVVEDYNIELTVIGPEVPLCLGLADLLEDHGHKVFGPRKAAANLEGSKAFSKKFMEKHHIPTAKYVEVTELDAAYKALNDFSYPVVIKADGLAAGKGVVICEEEEMAKETLKSMLSGDILAGAGRKVVIEEFLTGFECSLLCFTDGKTIVPMVSAKDHKQIYDNNKGPNTGGMGTVSPNPFMPNGMDEKLRETVLEPFVKGLQEDGLDFRGVIFIGLMIENNEAKVLEFNVRFGDPETQSILLRLDSDLYEIMNAVALSKLDEVEVKWKDEQVTCVVLSSGGYPGSYEKSLPITGLDQLPDDIIVFHAGTAMKDGVLVTNGGRVLNVCAVGKHLDETREKVYQAIEKIHFDGMYCRKDIGLH